MNFRHGTAGLALMAALIGVIGCAARSGPSGEVPEARSSGAPAATVSPNAGATEVRPVEEAVITVRDFAYELPSSVAPGATVTVVNEGEATHAVTAQDRATFEAVVAGGEATTFIAPEVPGAYPIICTYHPEISGTLIVGRS